MSSHATSMQLPEAPWPKTLRACPVRNRAVEARELSDSRVQITVRRKRPWFFLPPFSWLLPHHPTSTYELDTLGGEVWRWSDGDRSLEQIVDLCAEACDLTFHEARVAVESYVRQLVQMGILVLIAPEGGRR